MKKKIWKVTSLPTVLYLNAFMEKVRFIPHGDEFAKEPLVISQKDQSVAKPVDKNQFDDFENEIIPSSIPNC